MSTHKTIILPAAIPAGASYSLPGPIGDGDAIDFSVVAIKPPSPAAKFDVDYSPVAFSWSGLKAEMAANKGKRIGLGASRPLGWYLTTIFEPDPDVTFDLVQMAPIGSLVDDPRGFVYLRRPHGRWEMASGCGWTGPIKLSDFRGKPNANNDEQHHGIRQDGGDIAWVNVQAGGVHGDALAQRPYAADKSLPIVNVHGGRLWAAQRCGLGLIQCSDGSVFDGVTFEDIGTWPIDVETNQPGDRVGHLTISNCVIHAHNLAGNQSWGSSGVIAAIQFAGPQKDGPAAVLNCTGDQLDIVAKNLKSLSLANLTSVNKARLITSGVGNLTKSGLVNIS